MSPAHGGDDPPILSNKAYRSAPLFRPENLLREARRQKSIPDGVVPPTCVLDPDGDIVRYLVARGEARVCPHWACYHSELYEFDRDGETIGIIGCAVGAPFAVLLAEQLFVSGCSLLISITSAGQLKPLGQTPYFVLVEQALRDEGTSYHYASPAPFAAANPDLIAVVGPLLEAAGPRIARGRTWTTDAPFRETEQQLETGRAMGLAAIEMECAALYAFAAARDQLVVCLAHVTNAMAVEEGDFEKGHDQGARDALTLIGAISAQVDSVRRACARR